MQSQANPVSTPDSTLHLAVPKGRMFDNIRQLLSEAGIAITPSSRGYRPKISLPNVETKILKPQNIVEMLASGSRDLGFAGADWVAEKGADLVEIFDSALDPVRIVIAAPKSLLDAEGKLPTTSPFTGGPLRVAGEMERLGRGWIEANVPGAVFVRTFGATEVFPPEDADCIVDITQTGATLKANGLSIIDEIMQSSTRLYASHQAMAVPDKRRRIENLATLLESVLEGRRRVSVEVNVSAEKLEELVAILPCMRHPTIAELYGERGYAVKAAVPRADLPLLIPRIKAAGGSDVVISPVTQVVR